MQSQHCQRVPNHDEAIHARTQLRLANTLHEAACATALQAFVTKVEDALSPDSLSTHEEELASLLAKVQLADKEAQDGACCAGGGQL